MPRLEGLEYKELYGLSVDKENSELFFNDAKHLYVNKNNGSKYISVTTLIGEYENKFDEYFWSRYKALETFLDGDVWSNVRIKLQNTKKWNPELLTIYNIKEEDFDKEVNKIISEWAENRDEACEHGSWVHSLMENTFYGNTQFDFSKYGYAEASGLYDCPRNHYELDLENGVYPEFLMSWQSEDGVLKIAGQADLIIKQGDDIICLDWKGLDINTPILTTNGWKTMGTLTLEDKVFDKDGNPTNILHISEEHNNPCYELEFDNNDVLIADEDHRWLITFNKSGDLKETVLTTSELYKLLLEKPKQQYRIPKIYNPKPLNLPNVTLPIDPYVLGAWLGDGSKTCGVITNVRPEFWEEIKRRGYEISDNLSNSNRAEMRTVYGLRTELKKLNLLNNKHIPKEYLLASYSQRLDLLRGLMDTDGFLHKKRKRFVMETSQEWQAKEFAQLLCTLGLKPTIFDTINKLKGQEFSGWMCCWTNDKINPFLTRNQQEFNEIKVIHDNNSFRRIMSVKPVKTVTTKCIEVDSPTHTYLVGKHLIVTHNTNKEIKKRSFYDKQRKDVTRMKYPLNNFMDVNYYHYQLQLSTYAWILQQRNPNFNIKGLSIIHIDRQGKQTEYPLDYCKNDVERMIKHYHHQLIVQQQLDRIEPYKIG